MLAADMAKMLITLSCSLVSYRMLLVSSAEACFPPPDGEECHDYGRTTE
jgi:hypothetical protein